MDFEGKDQLRDIDRRLSQVESETARTPLTVPTVSEGNFVSILTARVVGVVSEGTATFAVNNIDLITGTDPRTDPQDAAEQITVKNTFSQAYVPSDKVFAIQREDDSEWEIWNPGEGTSSSIFRFRLVEDAYLDYTDSDVTARLIDEDGDDITTGTPAVPIEVIVVVSEGRWVAKPNQTGWGKQFTDDYNSSGKPGLALIHLERDLITIKGQVTGSAVGRTDPTFTVGNLEPVDGRLPLDDLGDTLTSVTANNSPPCVFANNDEVYLTYDISSGSSESNSWTTAHSKNITAILKGYAEFDAGKDLSLRSLQGSIEWGEVSGEVDFGTAYVVSTINAAVYDDSSTPKTITLGSGTMEVYTDKLGAPGVIELTGTPEAVYTISDEPTPTGRKIHWAMIDGRKHVVVEIC